MPNWSDPLEISKEKGKLPRTCLLCDCRISDILLRAMREHLRFPFLLALPCGMGVIGIRRDIHTALPGVVGTMYLGNNHPAPI